MVAGAGIVVAVAAGQRCSLYELTEFRFGQFRGFVVELHVGVSLRQIADDELLLFALESQDVIGSAQLTAFFPLHRNAVHGEGGVLERFAGRAAQRRPAQS